MKQNTGGKPTSADMVYAQLREQIFTQKRHAGERLPEVALARELGVSRTPVREALRRLAAEGLVLFIPNAGARLASPTREEIVNTGEVREHLECLAARKAALNITQEYIERLQAAIDEEERIFAERNLEAYLDINNRFHRTLAEASGNPVLAELVANVAARASVHMIFYESFFDRETNPSLDEHRALLKALIAHDPEKAEQLMRVHLMLSSASLKNSFGID